MLQLFVCFNPLGLCQTDGEVNVFKMVFYEIFSIRAVLKLLALQSSQNKSLFCFFPSELVPRAICNRLDIICTQPFTGPNKKKKKIYLLDFKGDF